MHEIELKLQVPPAQRAAVDAAVAGRRPGPRVRMQAAYHDTPDRALARAGLALRVRREGRRWVQTLKGATDDGLTRLEHNVSRGAGAAMPALDPALHAGTPVGARLSAVLAGAAGPLAVLYRTDILRRTRVLRTPHGRIEYAFDAGLIDAGGAPLAVLELEIELLAGHPRAVLDTAARWLPRFGLWVDSRSKAERGDLLARGEAMAPPRRAVAPVLTRRMRIDEARQAVLRACADQVIANASQVASGEHGAEHVHQLRVGLRRLRSALSLFDGLSDETTDAHAAATLAGPATDLFRRLGEARDRSVIADLFGAELRAAMRSAGLPDAPPTTPPADHAPTALLRETASQSLLLNLLAATLPAIGAATHPSVSAADDAQRAALAKRLTRWHRDVIADAKRFAELDDEQRHRLRKRAKRLRYALEFCAALFERRAVRRCLRALTALLERLGAFSDAAMALQALVREMESRTHAGADAAPHAMFAIGWLAARREALVAAAAPELKAFTRVGRCWKKREGRNGRR